MFGRKSSTVRKPARVRKTVSAEARAALARSMWLDESEVEERDDHAVKATIRWANERQVTSRLAMTGHYHDIIDKSEGRYN